MLTDQKFNGPLAGGGSTNANPDARGRMQLVKPQQVMNNGSAQASATKTASPATNGQTKSETLDADSQNYLNSLKNRQSAFKALSDLPEQDRNEVIAYFQKGSQQTPQMPQQQGSGMDAQSKAQLIIQNIKNRVGGGNGTQTY